MRADVTVERLKRFLRDAGRNAKPGQRLYLSGGSTAILKGWRSSTVDVDIHIEPHDGDLLSELARLKNRLDVNVEEASPLGFLPEPPHWRERCESIGRYGHLDVLHMDFYLQALAKVERDIASDRDDVLAMLDHGLVDPMRLAEVFEEIRPQLDKFIAVDEDVLARRLDRLLTTRRGAHVESGGGRRPRAGRVWVSAHHRAGRPVRGHWRG